VCDPLLLTLSRYHSIMSSNQRKRSASPSGDPNSPNKRQRKNNEDQGDEKKDEKDEKKHQDHLDEKDEKEEKKEREVKEDVNAPAVPFNDPDLVVSPSPVDKDLICSVCYSLLTKPISKCFFLSSSSHVSFPCSVYVLLFFLCRFWLRPCVLSTVR
jgi:hypothetical protein